MLRFAVHDVKKPALNFLGHLSWFILWAHGDIDILSMVVNLRNGANKELHRRVLVGSIPRMSSFLG
jgi:hypothetical protein